LQFWFIFFQDEAEVEEKKEKVEMVPTSLPELPKPTRNLNSSIKPEFLNPNSSCENANISFIIFINPFFGRPHRQGGMRRRSGLLLNI